MSAVELRSAAVDVGGRTVWHHLDATVEQGRFVAVLGPNGVGKSTLLSVLLGVRQLSAGTASVLDEPVRRGNPQIGYLPQRRTFDSSLRLRGRDIVALGVDGDRWGVPLPLGKSRRAKDARVDEVLELVGATAYADRPVGQCSGGEQQRLLIAQALVRRPRLLLLDEPLDSLDVANQASVSALVQRVCREADVTVLMVAHDVNPILTYLDQVLYLAHGGGVLGTPEEVVTTTILSRLYGTPVDVLTDRAGRLVVVGQPDLHVEHR